MAQFGDMRPILVPEDFANGRAAARANVTSLARAITATIRAYIANDNVARVLSTMWPHDSSAAAIVTKSATSPATMANTSALVTTIVADYLDSLGPLSAAAQLFQQGLRVSFGGAGIISVAGFVADAANSGFVAEALPVPVRSLSL